MGDAYNIARVFIFLREQDIIMKIFLDNIVFDLQKAGGISVYWSELVKRYHGSGHEVTFIEQRPETSNIFRKQVEINPPNIFYQTCLPSKISRYLPVRLNMDSPAIFHSSYFRVCNNANAINIVTVYDFIYELFESGLKQRVHRMQKKYALNNADAIICISESTKVDLLKLYPYLSPAKVKVIHIAAGNEFSPLENITQVSGPYEQILNKKYILFVGSRSNYKNFNLAIEAVSKLNDFSLVAVGGGELTDNDNHKLSPIRDRFFHVKSPSCKDLNLLYNFAFCLLYPSSYEGFGIPIAEAMKAGCPVITSSVSSIPEVAGDAGLKLEIICAAEIVAKINSLEKESFRAEVIERGYVQGNRFSWDRCFRETMECYEQAYNNKLSLKMYDK